jgi:hypothetical protein
MEMLNIDDGLRRLFRFERDVAPGYQRMDEEYKAQVNVPYTNVRIEDKYLGVYGICQMMYRDTKGLVMYEYAVDREVRRDGESLPGPFERVKDCEFHYYAMRLSVLAHLSGQKVDQLVIRDTYNSESIPVRYNRSLSEEFLKFLLGAAVDYAKKESKRYEAQKELFA